MTLCARNATLPCRLRAIPGMEKALGLLLLLCALFSLIDPFVPVPFGSSSKECACLGDLKRCVCARETIQALDMFQLFCLANARAAGFMLYPLYLCMFFTMCHNIRGWLQTTVVSEFVPIQGLHRLHVTMGSAIAVCILWHGMWHMIRWSVQGDNLSFFLLGHQTGITGLMAFLITPLLVFPMRVACIRDRLSFEFRKGLHYLSYVWAVAIMFHAPESNLFWVMGFGFNVYLLDSIYGLFVTTYLVPSARFVKLKSAVMIKVKAPPGFHHKREQGGYCYLNIPWISKLEWHAFSLFNDPKDPDHICFCISVAGDWTQKLHAQIDEPIHRRLWIHGPIPSPFVAASGSDHIISVASGIGITPALSAIESLAEKRKMHLIWMCRDAALLEFILDYRARFDDASYNFIFYTGHRELEFRREIPYNVMLFKGRPDLERLIVSIVDSVDNNKSFQSISGLEAMQQLVQLKPQKRLSERTQKEFSDGSSSTFNIETERLLQSNEGEEQEVDIETAPTAVDIFYAEMTRLLLTNSIQELFNDAVRRSHLNSRGVCYQGLADWIETIVTTRKFSERQLEYIFECIDVNGSGFIDFEDFEVFFTRMRQMAESRRKSDRFVLTDAKELESSFCHLNDSEASSNNNKDAASATKVERPGHWRLMYCGGSAPVAQILKKVSTTQNIALEIESFAW